MPEQIRALVVILFFAAIVFTFARRPAVAIIGHGDFTRRRNLWFLITLTAFLSQNFWTYALVSTALLLAAKKREANLVALYLMLLLTVPAGKMEIPGFGIINYLFALSHQRLLALIILLPALVAILRRPDESARFGWLWPDRLIAAYIILVVVLSLRDSSVTNVAREAFYQFTDVFLPYFVISRYLRDAREFRAAILALVLAVMLLALIASFEMFKHWLLYKSLINSLHLDQSMTGYLGRAGALRAIASAGHPIALGYLMAVAIGLYLYLQEHIKPKLYRRLGLLLLLAGLIAPLSRGPWVGTALVIIVFIWTGPHAIKRLSYLAVVAMLSLPILSVLPGGQKVIDLMPFLGTVEKENITYRERLLENSLIVIKRNPLLGSTNYLDTPEMQSMRQGQGIIDIVNSYIQVALRSGLVGLSLFGGFFLAVLVAIYRSMKKIRPIDDDLHRMGRSLFATLSGILLIIFTVSSISIIPLVYWIIAGMGVAYVQLVRKRIAETQAPQRDSGVAVV